MKVPFELTSASDLQTRYKNMESSIARGLPRLQDVPIDDFKSISIACYGPSLRETWKDIKHPIISCSGATRFLADRGIIADYHVDLDPRKHKVALIDPPVSGVTYLIASVCDPVYFDLLKDEKVILWHAVSSNMKEDSLWLQDHDPNELIVSTGSHVGLAALQIGGLLGYRHFEIFGMDGCFADDGKRHAADHTGKVQSPDYPWNAGGKTYYTSKVMANGVAETVNAMTFFPVFCVFHGEGLIQALIEQEKLLSDSVVSQVEKTELIRNSKANFFDIPVSERSRHISWGVWEDICFSNLNPNWIYDLQVLSAEAEKRRSLAKLNTGSISLESMLILRGLCDWRKPDVIVEVGTFIGKSTFALQAQKCIHTCDKDNDCVVGTGTIKVYPYQTSTQMFRSLIQQGVKADLFFFDGRLTDEDIMLIRELSTPYTIYSFDDFNLSGKGAANVVKLHPVLSSYVLIEPYPPFSGRSTVALLIPVQEALV